MSNSKTSRVAQPQNPWLDIVEQDGLKVARCDLEYIEKKYGSLAAMMDRFRDAKLRLFACRLPPHKRNNSIPITGSANNRHIQTSL